MRLCECCGTGRATGQFRGDYTGDLAVLNGRWHCQICAERAFGAVGGEERFRAGAAGRAWAQLATGAQPSGPGGTTCSECNAPAAKLRGGACVYCVTRTLSGMVTAREHDTRLAAAADALPSNVRARQRLAAAERKERPRGNPTDRREFARAHPWAEFDELESR